MRYSIYLGIPILIFFNSCYTPRYVYSPPAQHVPMLQQKKDIVIAGFYSTNFATSSKNATIGYPVKNSGADIQAAYAFHKNYAFQADYSIRKEVNDGNYQTTADSSRLNYSLQSWNLGIGYYSQRKTSSLHWQLFAGIGNGMYGFRDYARSGGISFERFHKISAFRVYIQPAFILKPSPVFYTSFSSRISLLSFYNMRTDYSPVELNNYKLDSTRVSPALFWEPAWVANVGFKKVPGISLEFQAGLALLLSRNFVDSRPFNFSAGIKLDVKHLLKKTPAKTATTD